MGKKHCCNGRKRGDGWDPSNRAKVPPGEHAGDGYCYRKAGAETPHRGEGRCAFHGGMGGAEPEHGLYSNLREDLREKVGEAKTKDQPGDLWEEVAVIRALLDRYLSGIDEIDTEAVDAVAKIQSELRKTVNNIHEMMMRQRPSEEEVTKLTQTFANVLKRHVPEERQAKALEDLRRASADDERDRLPSGDGLGDG